MSEFYEIEYTGFHCVRESKVDGLSNQDEPYFLFSVSDGFQDLPVKMTKEYEHIHSGTTKREAGGMTVWRTTDLDNERNVVALTAAAFEADFGDKSKAEDAFKKAVNSVVKAGVGAAVKSLAAGGKGAIAGGLPGAAIGFGTALVASLAAELAAEIANFRDDQVGVSGVFLSRDDIRRLAGTKVNWFGDDPIPWHLVLRIKGGDEGTYFLFFRVVSHEGAGLQGGARASLDQIFAGPTRISRRAVVTKENAFLTSGAAHGGNMLMMSNYHDAAFTRKSPNGSSERYWRWHGGQQFSHIVPGRFSPGRSAGEYLMYRASDGRFSILMRGRSFLTSGGQTSEGDHTIIDGGQLLPDCNIAVPGVFSGNAARNRTTDLLLYRSDGGRQEYYTFRRGSNGPDTNPVVLRDTFKNWQPGWDIIVPIDWPGRDRTSLLLYSRDRGRGEFWHTTGDAQISRASSHGFFKTWSFITQVGRGFTEDEQVYLMFYSQSRKRAQVWSFPNVKKHADIQMEDYEFLIPDYAQHSNGDFTASSVYGYKLAS